MNEQELQKLPFDLHQIFNIQSEEQFSEIALQVFDHQYKSNEVYRRYVQLIGKKVKEIKTLKDIPFLPISFFKTHQVKSFKGNGQLTFKSSGTTGQDFSEHHIYDPALYQLSFLKGFEAFYGHIEDYLILGLLPSYMENNQSSLIYMFDHLMQMSGDRESGFFLNDDERLLDVIERRKADKKILLIGVSYALLDLAEKYQPNLEGTIVMETGGMKGRRKELTKEELHSQLKTGLKVQEIHSEYGMTELLSQAYSNADGIFKCPAWMKVMIRSTTDPIDFSIKGTGGINVIDLANIHTCSFIQTEDLGRFHSDGFKVLGRFDNSDLRGCNLLIQ